MATNETKRLSADILKEDSDVLVAIKKMPDYVPAKAQYSVVNADAKEADMGAKQDTETEKEIEYGSARDNACAAEWAFHNFILNMKDQVVALYGKDSNEVQAVGLKKKSERAKRKTKKTTTPTPPTPPTA